MKVAIIGTYPPRQCGIATFTHDLLQSLRPFCEKSPGVIAVSDGSESAFPDEVDFVIDRDRPASYSRAAQYINGHYDVVVIQHEYGIFGGTAGQYILNLARELQIPLVTNFHTVLKRPSPDEKTVLQILAGLSQQVTVMTRFGIDLLADLYRVCKADITMIPHGVPNFPYSQEEAKSMLHLLDRKIMLSFGFLGPGKGFETAIQALTNIRNPEFVYIILGSTHPNILREEGETYRESLIQLAEQLNVRDRVIFVNEFASEELLVKYLCACDLYVTPYPNEHQISSGTLSFAIGAGAAVLSTPYWYAKDLLSNHRGLLFDFRDSKALSALINQLLAQPRLLAKYRRNAASYGKRMTWSQVGKLHGALLEKVLDPHAHTPLIDLALPEISENITALFGASEKKLSF